MRPLMTPVAIPFQLSHCSAMPSCESNALVSTILPAASGTLYSLPSVRTPSTSIRSRRICAASSVTEEGTVVQFYEKSCQDTEQHGVCVALGSGTSYHSDGMLDRVAQFVDRHGMFRPDDRVGRACRVCACAAR